jgi:hypothetical protein
MALVTMSYCKCDGFTPQESQEVDEAVRQAQDMVRTVLTDSSPSVASALKHHFKIDVAAARGIGLGFQDQWITGIYDVFRKIQQDFQMGMTYVKTSGSAAGSTASFRPEVVYLYPNFFSIGANPLRGRAIIHEQAHFASRLPGALNTIKDRGWPWAKDYYELNPSAYSNMSTGEALHNADSYAWFAYEVCYPGNFIWVTE